MSNCQRAKPALHSLLPSNKPYRFPSNSIRRGLTARIDDTVKLVWRIYSSSTSHSPLPSKSLSQVRKSTTAAQVHSNGNWLIRRLLYVVGSGVVIALCCNRFFCETIPYSNRRHFVIFSPNWEKKVGDSCVKTFLGKHILPATHPQTIRVRRIANNITEALQREIIIDRDRDREEGSRVVAATSHLNGKKWDIYVEVNPQFCAKGLVGARGTIVISTGFLHQLKRDEEIATVISHEIAHDVARHTAEDFSNPILLLNNVREAFHVENGSENYLFSKLSTYLFSLSQRMEMEADYIGMLLLASAGYDPKVAPDVYMKLGKLAGQDPNKIYNFSIHPSGKMRAEKLAQAHIMEEALSKYQDVRVGQNDIENFVESQKYRQEKIFMHSAQWLGTTIRRWGRTHLTQRRQPHLGGRAILTPTSYIKKY